MPSPFWGDRTQAAQHELLVMALSFPEVVTVANCFCAKRIPQSSTANVKNSTNM
jgi:hypothetical protein